MRNLLEKYGVQGPRYTSFPAVPHWKGAPAIEKWKESLDAAEIDIYIHIPFCKELCSYCGCHRVITKNESRQDPYVEALIEEWKLYRDGVWGGKPPRINSIHLGGGTPTFLSPANLHRLASFILGTGASPNFIGAIEVDPRTCQDEHLTVLRQLGFSRISMGVQDFDPNVQTEIRRHQSVAMVEKLVASARQKGFESVTFDLIYGLPAQTLESFTQTLNTVMKLAPDQIALYNYAHLPDKISNQKLINADLLPQGMAKTELFLASEKIFLECDYVSIGLDHFAKRNSPLGRAKLEKRLLRNFMGHTDKKSSVMIGLGVSSISNTPDYFVQNEKEIAAYQNKIAAGELPITFGHCLTLQDKIVGEIIQDLMCNERITQANLETLEALDASYTRQEIEKKMVPFIQDGILSASDGGYLVMPGGRLFLRNVAMAFDPYLKQNAQTNSPGKNNFSRTI